MELKQLETWLNTFKTAWENGDQKAAVSLFKKTERYYERPFKPGTTQSEIEGYWKDIEGLEDIKLEYKIVSFVENVACIHWQNSFSIPGDDKDYLLDGMFMITFSDTGDCIEFRQWWFMKD